MTQVHRKPAARPRAAAMLGIWPGRITALAEAGDALVVAVWDAAARRSRLIRLEADGAEAELTLPAGAATAPVLAMARMQGTSDAAPRLYVVCSADSGGLVLAVDDTGAAEVVLGPRHGFRCGIGAACLWAGRLALATGPAAGGMIGGGFAPASLIVSDDPARPDSWQPFCEPGLGDADNDGISALAAEDDRLWLATSNPLRGFQLWTMANPAAEGWEQRLDEGAARYGMNARLTAIQPWNGALLLATGCESEDPLPHVAPELLRLDGDGDWDLLVGEPRFSRQGMQVPAALFGPGFDSDCDRIALAGTGDALFAATCFGAGGRSSLYRSTDGETWEEIGATVFGDDVPESADLHALGGRLHIAAGGMLLAL
ncbi:hypothetical protein [Frigidibacter oleivorans]|uniref:hypothetical protein n=1 Tax=Frigidibacter oleivorans TaxID=2487129 RepID=UPI000F8D4951|nr:hypothetical protein [Frigidibacter oleivorans]